MDALTVFHSHDKPQKDEPGRSSLKSIDPPIFSRPATTASLFDCDNFNFATIQLHGLTDPLSDNPLGKWGHIGDRSAAGIRLVLAYDPERLAAIIVAQDRDLGAERDYDRVTRFRLRNRARDAFREVAYIPRGQFQSAPAVVGVRNRLSGLERLLAVGKGVLEPAEAGLGHKVGMRGNRPRRQAHLLCGLRALFPESAAEVLELNFTPPPRPDASATARKCSAAYLGS
jgi:hypothetical protein